MTNLSKTVQVITYVSHNVKFVDKDVAQVHRNIFNETRSSTKGAKRICTLHIGHNEQLFS